MPESDIAALERFVSENDELLQLEEAIGRFNVFDALRIARKEIRHSEFLAWILTPGESHDWDDLFLKSLLMDLARKAREQGMDAPVSPITLESADLGGIAVRREWRNIDLLLVSDSPSFVIAIENKVDSSERVGQLQRYENVVAAEFPGRPHLFVYLTREGSDASDDDWLTYGYADLHHALSRTRRMHAGSIGNDVGLFLNHYLNLIENRFMENEQIDKLCREIYANHRRALDLIMERIGTPNSELIRSLHDWILRQPDIWIFVTHKQREVECIPTAWAKVLPPINARRTFDARHWITVRLHLHRDRMIRLSVQVHPTIDQRTRERIVERLTRDPEEFGFSTSKRGRSSGTWTKIFAKDICELPSEDLGEADLEPLIKQVETFVNAFQTRIAGVANAIASTVKASS